MKLSDIRSDYAKSKLIESEMSPNPFEQFHKWLEAAKNAGIRDFNAMSLATADESGHANVRIVLLKELDETGFVFFTNYNSEKGKELLRNPNASICFFWKEIERQINIKGMTEKLERAQSDEYFQSRPRNSQLGAWASSQSTVLSGGYQELQDKFSHYEKLYADQPVPTPPHWGGYRLIPTEISFWQGRPSRLHDRIKYVKAGKTWDMQRISP